MNKQIFLLCAKCVVVLLFLVMAGCEKFEDPPTTTLNIVGCWINPVYLYDTEGKTIIWFEKSKKLSANSYGIKFLNDGTLIERKNAGWCGTPPICYADFSGNWQIQENGNIIIDVAYWGGMERYDWKIIDIAHRTLKVEVVFREVL